MDHLQEEEQPLLRSVFMFSCLCLCFISCAQTPEKNSAIYDEPLYHGEAISFLGDTLQAPVDREEIYHVKDSLLKEANTAYLADSNDLENIIWMGRRLAYLHRYKEAIQIFTRGISIHPKASELYRHRGHRYINVRRIDDAIQDLTTGIVLLENRSHAQEADGIPNELNIPLSNLHFNLFYHLGLAYYMQADYDNAITAFRSCMKYSDNPDLKVATSDWWYLSYMRSGDTLSAAKLLESIHPDMEIIENKNYLNRLLLYKGVKNSTTFSAIAPNPLENATKNYGLSCWYEINGNPNEASVLRRNILASGFWPAFGYIAAEADSARTK